MTRPARTRTSNRICETSLQVEVPFHDVDALQIVWHGHYYKYFELARTQLLRARDLDGPDVIALGFGMLVIESQCRYVLPLRYGNTILVRAWLADVAHRLHFQFEIETAGHADARVAARGHTTLVATTLEGELLHRTPKIILDRLGA